MCVLHTVKMQDIIDDLRCELEELEIKLGLKRVHYYHIVKVGCVYGMMDKINLQEWKDLLTKILLKLLNFKHLISLHARKIDDG